MSVSKDLSRPPHLESVGLTCDPAVDLDHELAKSLTAKLKRAGTIDSFTDNALEELWMSQYGFVERVASDAIELARINSDESVGVKHVRQAIRVSIQGRRPTVSKALEPIGGVAAGAGIAQAANLLLSESARSTGSIGLMLLLLILGVAMLSAAFSQSMSRS